jgi:hypothetical protein
MGLKQATGYAGGHDYFGLRIAECGMRNEERGMRNEERGMRNEERGMKAAVDLFRNPKSAIRN